MDGFATAVARAGDQAGASMATFTDRLRGLGVTPHSATGADLPAGVRVVRLLAE